MLNSLLLITYQLLPFAIRKSKLRIGAQNSDSRKPVPLQSLSRITSVNGKRLSQLIAFLLFLKYNLFCFFFSFFLFHFFSFFLRNPFMLEAQIPQHTHQWLALGRRSPESGSSSLELDQPLVSVLPKARELPSWPKRQWLGKRKVLRTGKNGTNCPFSQTELQGPRGFTLGVKHSMDFDKWIPTYILDYSIIQNSSPVLKILCSLLIFSLSPLTSGNH